MTAATLLEKAQGSFSPKTIETMLLPLFQDLEVKVNVRGKTALGWMQVEVTGEDEAVALRLLDREIGLAPVVADKVGKFSVLRGKVIEVDKSTSHVRVDVGVLSPRVYDAVIPLQRLQAQLSDGRNLPLQLLTKLYCLYDYAPLCVKIVGDLDFENGSWEAELSEAQLSLYSTWLESNLDRLMVLGASRGEIENAVERSGHFRDVLEVEALGLLEHVIPCKLGTDAVGLMPKLGPYMRRAFLTPFSPRRIKQEVTREE